MKRIRKILKKDKYDKRFINDFINFHQKQDVNGFLVKTIENVEEKELREIVGGMLAVYDLVKTIPLAEKTNNTNLMDLILLNMLHTVDQKTNL